MQKTLGGDRLGSGKKMKVNMHGYERSTHDLGYIFRSTMSCGTLVPFMKQIGLPGDTFDIDLNCDVKTHPTVGPLFGSYKVQLDIFQCPMRLYNAQLHNNKLGIGLNMSVVKFPTFNLRAIHSETLIPNGDGAPIDSDNYQVNPSSILAYLGIRGAGTNRDTGSDDDVYRGFNATAWLSYWDIYKNYYSNKQEEIGMVVHTHPVDTNQEIVTLEISGNAVGNTPGAQPPRLIQNNFGLTIDHTAGLPQDPTQVMLLIGPSLATATLRPLNTISIFVSDIANTQTFYIQGIVTFPTQWVFNWEYSSAVIQPLEEITIESFPLSNIDEMREVILAAPTGVPFNIIQHQIAPWDLAMEENANLSGRAITQSQEGLGLKTYQSDLLNNWLSTEWIDGVGGISEITSVDTSGGSFTMDTLALAKKVYDMLNRIAVSGGTYDDWLDVTYDHDRFTRAESPIYHGGLIKELHFQEVVSQTEVEGGQPLGTLAGKGVMGNKHKGGQITIRVDEPSYIIGIVSLTPRIDYSQGNDWDVHLQTMDDIHKPGLDEIGFQELITEQMAWWDTEWNHSTLEWITKSAGKQPAWINYMTNINRVRGNFAVRDNEMFMTLNRSYTPLYSTNDVEIQDLTTYIDPRIYNQIFADTALDSQNFWTQIGIDMKVRRKISAKIMPNL